MNVEHRTLNLEVKKTVRKKEAWGEGPIFFPKKRMGGSRETGYEGSAKTRGEVSSC